MFMEKSALQSVFDKAKVATQNTIATALGDIVTKNVTNQIRLEESWSAHLLQRHSGKQIVYLSAHKNLTIPATNTPD